MGGDNDNVIAGRASKDILNVGGAGNNILVGYSQDSVNDVANKLNEQDTFGLKAYSSDEPESSKKKDSLFIRHLGSDDLKDETNCVANSNYQQFKLPTADNKTTTVTQVQNLLTAMAGFTLNVDGDLSSTEQMQQIAHIMNLSSYWGN